MQIPKNSPLRCGPEFQKAGRGGHGAGKRMNAAARAGPPVSHRPHINKNKSRPEGGHCMRTCQSGEPSEGDTILWTQGLLSRALRGRYPGDGTSDASCVRWDKCARHLGLEQAESAGLDQDTSWYAHVCIAQSSHEIPPRRLASELATWFDPARAPGRTDPHRGSAANSGLHFIPRLLVQCGKRSSRKCRLFIAGSRRRLARDGRPPQWAMALLIAYV